MKQVSVVRVIQHSHSLMNDVVLNTASVMDSAFFLIKLEDRLKERGMTQKELAQLTGIRVGTVSEWINGKNISINKVQLIAIMSALRLTSVSDILEVRLPADLLETFEKESAEWIESHHMPDSVRELYKENVLKSAGL